VTPLFKKVSRSIATNYRPVSLTSQIVKLFERLIQDAIITHIIEPCGTLLVTFIQLEDPPGKTTFWRRLLRKDTIHLKTLPRIPAFLSFNFNERLD
jgi:hypothetical protein